MSEYGKVHTDGSRSGGQPLDDSIEEKALALINEVLAERELPSKLQMCRLSQAQDEALCRAIERHEADKAEHETQIYVMHSRIAQTEEQHEAFKQEVSDALVDYFGEHLVAEDGGDTLASFVIFKPKPNPLVDVAKSLGYFNTAAQHWAGDVRAALDALGFEIREKGQ